MIYFENDRIEAIINERRHYIFDMNGLILDDEPIQLDATNRAFENYNLKIGEKVWRDSCVGRKPMDYLPHLLMEAASKIVPEDEILTKIALKDSIYRGVISKSGPSLLRKGIVQFMKHIKSFGGKISICTSTTSEGMRIIIGNDRLKIGDLVDFTVCGDQVRKSKPDPEIYIKTCRAAGFLASESIAFEDSFAGLHSAIGAQLECIVCPNKFTLNQDFSGSTMIISDFTPEARSL